MKKQKSNESRRWFIQARDEFQDSEELRKRKRFYLALFHFQQAAEKALKAYLYNVVSSEEVFFTHSIYELLALAQEQDIDFKQLNKAPKLDEYYIPTRYPNGLPGAVPSRFYNDPAEAKEAMLLAKSVIDLVGGKLE